MTKINGLFEALKDGKWHDVGELAGLVGLDKERLEDMLEFLDDYDFLTFDKALNSAKLDKDVVKFLKEVEGW